MEKELCFNDINAYVEAHRANILRDIARLVAVPSVEGEPQPDAPFGIGPKNALEETLKLAQEMGLATHNAENHIGWAEVAGADPEKYLATICHVDVVPEGNGWDADPYTMRERDGWLLGRGVSDDKGPMVLCLYALKYLKDKNISLRYPVRALIGCNEETHMQDVAYYKEHFSMPAFCFTPDAEFPVCNGEKGGFNANLVSNELNGVILEMEGGVANNAVPDRASALVAVPMNRMKQTPNVTLEAEGTNTRVRGWGKSGHAATPEGTRNAIGLVVDCLLASACCTPEEEAYLKVLQKLHASTDGSTIGMDSDDGNFTPLTVIGGRIFKNGAKITQTLDCRWPTSTNPQKLQAALVKLCGSAADVEEIAAKPPFYISADSEPIQLLINTYNEVTGENATPFTMGGGTYARHFPVAVSFGPEHVDLPIPEFGGPMHGANEAAPIEKLIEAAKIYILALLRLEELEF